MKLSRTSAILSSLAYEQNPTTTTTTTKSNNNVNNNEEYNNYDDLKFFEEEPDQALVVKKDGYCYGVFRGTTLTMDDWMQNLRVGIHNVTILDDDHENDDHDDENDENDNKKKIKKKRKKVSVDTQCQVRIGFWDAYNTIYRQQFERAIRNCAQETCGDTDEDENENENENEENEGQDTTTTSTTTMSTTTSTTTSTSANTRRTAVTAAVTASKKKKRTLDDCVIFTGHSQGGAIAAVAGIVMADLNPYVITFGQPPTIIPPCSLVSSDRWYRYINTKSEEAYGIVGIVYDPVPFSPGLGAQHVGHMILLGEDTTGVAYMGLDVQNFFGPIDANGFHAHNMIDAGSSNGTTTGTTYYPGYQDRIDRIITKYNNNNTMLLNNEQQQQQQSKNRKKQSFTRKSSLITTEYPVRTTGYIAGSLCTENNECITNECKRETGFSYSRCVGKQCSTDNDCITSTGRCDNGLCLPKLGSCMKCDENTDCIYNKCTWNFRCTGPNGLLDNDCDCNFNKECKSGRCEGTDILISSNDDDNEEESNRVCRARLPIGARCNENSDCITKECSWEFRCVEEGRKQMISSSSHQLVLMMLLITTFIISVGTLLAIIYRLYGSKLYKHFIFIFTGQQSHHQS